jgi:hypothetical protein
VLNNTNEVSIFLGFFPVDIELDLLSKMKTYSIITLGAGLVFTLIIFLFATISTLLIYSLLMITTETKRFENGLMRVVGLSKTGYASMILL